MKINSRNIAKVLLWTVIAYAWLTGTLIMSVLYLALSTMLNDGHPWPYNPLLLFGLIPLVIAGGLAGVLLLAARLAAVDLRKLFRSWEFYTGLGISFATAAGLFAAGAMFS